MTEYRYEHDFTPMVDKIAAQIQYHIDQAALDKVENKLAEFGYVKVVRCRDCNGTCRNEWAEFGKFRCSECWLQVDAISTNTTQPASIKFCPNCGAKVIHQ